MLFALCLNSCWLPCNYLIQWSIRRYLYWILSIGKLFYRIFWVRIDQVILLVMCWHLIFPIVTSFVIVIFGGKGKGFGQEVLLARTYNQDFVSYALRSEGAPILFLKLVWCWSNSVLMTNSKPNQLEYARKIEKNLVCCLLMLCY